MIKKTFIIKTPIEINLDYVSDNELLIINLKNEEIFKPTPDRERLTKEAETKLKRIIEEQMKQALKIKPCHDLKSWDTHDHKWFIASDSQQIKDVLDPQSLKLNELLNQSVTPIETNRSNRRNNRVSLKFQLDGFDLSQNNNLFFIEKRDQRKIDTLDYYFNNNYFMIVLNPRFYDNFVTAQAVRDQFTEYGFKSAKEFIKENKIKLADLLKDNNEQPTIEDDITFYYSYEFNDHYRNREIKVNTLTKFIDQLSDFDKSKVIIVKGFNQYRYILKKFQTDKLISDYDDQTIYYITPEKNTAKI